MISLKPVQILSGYYFVISIAKTILYLDYQNQTSTLKYVPDKTFHRLRLI